MVHIQPMPLQSRPLPFDDPDFLCELKYDGFRALAVIENGRCQLISRNGNPFASFADLARDSAAVVSRTRLTVLDGEIVCLDKKGRRSSRTCSSTMAILASSHSICWFGTARTGAGSSCWTANMSCAGCWHGCLPIPGCDTWTTLTGLGRRCFAEYASWIWKASWPS
jgi:hypothetical protein